MLTKMFELFDRQQRDAVLLNMLRFEYLFVTLIYTSQVSLIIH